MARTLLTGPLPKDIGAGMAVIAARDVLKKWTETRVDQAVGLLDIVVEDWKRENDVTGLQAVVIDTIDVLLDIQIDQKEVPAIKDLSMQERVALAILIEAMVRPHAATKGGAVLAAYTAGMIEYIHELYDSEWLPNIRRGVKVRRSAAEGHAIVHGSREEKNQRWTGQCEAVDRALKTEVQKTRAKEIAAEQCGVSVKTIERSLEKRRQGKL